MKYYNILRRSALLLFVGLLLSATASQAQVTVTSANGFTSVTITFLGVTDNGDGTYTWEYRIYEEGGSGALSNWVLELCLPVDNVVSTSPAGGVEFGLDPNTGVNGIKFETDGGVGGPPNGTIFSFTIDVDLPVTDVVVAIKGGGMGSPSQKTGSGVIGGPNCECLDVGAPMWDGDIETGDGMGTIMLDTPGGLKVVEIGDPSTNIALYDVQDADGNSLNFAGSGAISGAECSGYSRFDWDGAAEDAPTAAKVIICAPEQGRTNFFLHISDCCDRTLRVDPALSLFAVAAGTDTDEVPQAFALRQNYPNPFNPSTSIQFELPAETQVRLVVFDLMGREVATLAQGTFDAGVHTATWDGRSATGVPVTSGVYLYRLEAGSFSLTQRMMLLK